MSDQPSGRADPEVRLGHSGSSAHLADADRLGSRHPLHHHLQTTGVGWLVAAVVLMTVSLLVFAGGLDGPAVAVTVVDDAVVGGWPGCGRGCWR